ncbi:hypothetical protein [Streptomyces caniscabiei]|uniref:hypothetical protein n=1 Tax=Streptomyces caniscabiei TaxID=2746961 RepID=UPI0029B9FA16|nr:hypothetical protein [Streptomyces caniscabiei]MDX3733625.1 hypothetical protein [Streptomyces caniscabiei]
MVTVGIDAHAVPMIRNPITLSATETWYVLPPPDLDQHGAELRAWLTAGKDTDQ